MENICWNITHKCNRYCKHCFRDANEKDLLIDENIKILYDLISIGIKKITWSGGEPTEYEGIDKLLRIAKENGVYNKLVTNASNFIEKNDYCIFNYIDEVIFSIDTVDDRLNEEIGRGTDYFQHIKEVIKILKSDYPSCCISVNTIVMRPTIDYIDDVYREINKIGIKKWKLIQFCSFRGVAILNKRLFEVTSEEYSDIVNRYRILSNNFEFAWHTSKQVEKEHILVSSSGKIIK